MAWWQPFGRRKNDGEIAPECWQALLRELPGLKWLEDDNALLKQRAEQILAAKPMEGVGGLELNANMRLRISALAALPLLHRPLHWYRNFYTFVVYPDDFLVDREEEDEFGVTHRIRAPLAGETDCQGAVILSWTAVLDSGLGTGFNVVVHELAHKLDMLSGIANGVPPMSADRSSEWEADFTALRTRLLRTERSGGKIALDPYAMESAEEGFAVCCEYFFDAPNLLHQQAPAAYRQLATFFGCDPARVRVATI